jgi:hypothetical protein
MQVDTTGWSGDGDFTQALIGALETVPGVAAVRVEDAPSSRSDAGYLFLSNEVYVRFDTRERIETTRWLGVVFRRRRWREPVQTLAGLASILVECEAIGPADYSDHGMLQYLRTERIVPPYQTRGYKLVEMVRIYEAGEARGDPAA